MVDPHHTPPQEFSTPELVSRLSREVSLLVRDELRLAQIEMTGKAKKAGIGAGLFGVAGLVALFGAGTLVATGVLALALVLDAWLAALVVGVALLAIAAIAALLGRRQVGEATPPLPQETLDSVREDVDVVAKGAHR